MKTNILIAGGTGLVGSRIIELLDPTKYDIRILTRSPKPQKGHISYYRWDVENLSIDENALKDVDYIINLTGAGIADKKWSSARKKVLIDSRVNSNKTIQKALKQSNHKVKTIIGASAVGFYGDRADEILTETSKSGSGFLAECCEKWENSIDELSELTERLVKLRIGIVLSTKGGALPKILMTSKLGLYTYFGDGKQYYPWIHIDDVARMFIASIEGVFSGTYNAVTEPMSNIDFTKTIKKTLGGWLMIPAPAVALKMAMGEMSAVVLGSSRAVSEKIRSEHFEFKYPDLSQAITSLIENKI